MARDVHDDPWPGRFTTMVTPWSKPVLHPLMTRLRTDANGTCSLSCSLAGVAAGELRHRKPAPAGFLVGTTRELARAVERYLVVDRETVP